MDIEAELNKILEDHRKQAFITCREDCLCWKLEAIGRILFEGLWCLEALPTPPKKGE